MNIHKNLQIRKPLFTKYLLIISVLGFLIRLVFALILPLDGGDETFQLLITKKPLIPMIQGTISAWPPLWQIVLHFLNLITHNYIYIRLVTAFIGATSIFFAGRLGRSIFNTKVGLLASLIFCFSPALIYFSINVRMYSLSILISVLIFYYFWELLKVNSTKHKLLLFTSMLIGNYTYYLFPVLGICFGFYLFLTRGIRSKIFKQFAVIYLSTVITTLPLYYAFLNQERLPREILPTVTIFKIISIPINYSFPLNLAQLTNFYPYYRLNPVNTALISLAVLTTLIAIYGLFLNQNTSHFDAGMNGSQKNFPKDTPSALLQGSSFCVRIPNSSAAVDNSQKKFLITTILISHTVLIIFSLLNLPVFGFRSLILFSIPFYLLIAIALNNLRRTALVYFLFPIVALILMAKYFYSNVSQLDSYLANNTTPGQSVIHSEITTYNYFSYIMPGLHHFSNNETVYTNRTMNRLLDYNPVNPERINDQTIWVVEIKSKVHEIQREKFENMIFKRYSLSSQRQFGEIYVLKLDKKKN